MFDMNIESARAAVNIPVVGLASATYHVASQLADRFGIISTNEKTVPAHKRNIKAMGFPDHIVSIRALDIPILESIDRKEEMEDKFLEIARDQINKEGADLIISGSGSIFPALGAGSRERIEKKLGVPVLEGSGVALKTLELMVNLKLTQSKKAYPSPTE
jgi:allantoin racemase